MISIGVSEETQQSQFNHRLELLLRLGEDFALGGVMGGESRVGRGNSCQHSPLLDLCCAKGQEHRPGDLSEGLRHPEDVAPLRDDLEEDFGGQAWKNSFQLDSAISNYLCEHAVHERVVLDTLVVILHIVRQDYHTYVYFLVLIYNALDSPRNVFY